MLNSKLFFLPGDNTLKKKIIFLSFFLCIAKLFAHTNIQIIAPIISQCLIHISPDENASYKNINITGLALNFQTFFKEKNWGLYTSLAFASNESFNLDNTGIKIAAGPAFKISEKENYHMNIGFAPQFIFHKKNLIYLGYEIDFQTKFNPNKRISPIVGIYSATNFIPHKKNELLLGIPVDNIPFDDKYDDNHKIIYNNSYSDTNEKSYPNFYLDIGIQVYLALSINFN